MKFIEPNALNRAGFSVGENDGFSDEFGLHVSEHGKNRGRAELHNGHSVPQRLAVGAVVLHSKGVEVVAGTGQPSVGRIRNGSRNHPMRRSVINDPIEMPRSREPLRCARTASLAGSLATAMGVCAIEQRSAMSPGKLL